MKSNRTVTDDQLEKAFQLAYFLFPIKKIALSLTITAYSLISRIPKVQHGSKVPDEALLQYAIYLAVEVAEKDEKTFRELVGSGYKLTRDDLIIRYVMHLIWRSSRMRSCYMAIALGCLLYRYTPTSICKLSGGCFDDSNIRRVKSKIVKWLRERFEQTGIIKQEVEDIKVVAPNSPEYSIIQQSLRYFTPWRQNQLQCISKEALFETLFYDDSSSPDWDRTCALIDPDHAGIESLIRWYKNRFPKSRLTDPGRMLAIPAFEDQPSGNPTNRMAPPTLSEDEKYLLERAIEFSQIQQSKANYSNELYEELYNYLTGSQSEGVHEIINIKMSGGLSKLVHEIVSRTVSSWPISRNVIASPSREAKQSSSVLRDLSVEPIGGPPEILNSASTGMTRLVIGLGGTGQRIMKTLLMRDLSSLTQGVCNIVYLSIDSDSSYECSEVHNRNWSSLLYEARRENTLSKSRDVLGNPSMIRYHSEWSETMLKPKEVRGNNAMEDDIGDITLKKIVGQAANDNDAFDSLMAYPMVKQHLDKISAWAGYKFKQNSADIRGGLVLKLWRNIRTIHNPDGFGFWFYKVVRNYCLNEIRRRNRESAYIDEIGYENCGGKKCHDRSMEQSAAVPAPEQESLDKDQKLLFEDAVRRAATWMPISTVYRKLKKMQKAIIEEGYSRPPGKNNDPLDVLDEHKLRNSISDLQPWQQRRMVRILKATDRSLDTYGKNHRHRLWYINGSDQMLNVNSFGIESCKRFLKEVNRFVYVDIDIICSEMRNDFIEKTFSSPTVIKEGNIVAKEIELEGNLENTSAQVIREVGSKTSGDPGYGKTTATVQAQATFREGVKTGAASENNRRSENQRLVPFFFSGHGDLMTHKPLMTRLSPYCELTDFRDSLRSLEELQLNREIARIDVRIDLENIFIGLVNRGWCPNLRKLTETIRQALEKQGCGEVVSTTGYADFDELSRHHGMVSVNRLHRLTLTSDECSYGVHQYGKNTADMKIGNDTQTPVTYEAGEGGAVSIIGLAKMDRDFRHIADFGRSLSKSLGLANRIDLTEIDLSSVLGGFGWAASANSSQNLVFFPASMLLNETISEVPLWCGSIAPSDASNRVWRNVYVIGSLPGGTGTGNVAWAMLALFVSYAYLGATAWLALAKLHPNLDINGGNFVARIPLTNFNWTKPEKAIKFLVNVGKEKHSAIEQPNCRCVQKKVEAICHDGYDGCFFSRSDYLVDSSLWPANLKQFIREETRTMKEPADGSQNDRETINPTRVDVQPINFKGSYSGETLDLFPEMQHQSCDRFNPPLLGREGIEAIGCDINSLAQRRKSFTANPDCLRVRIDGKERIRFDPKASISRSFRIPLDSLFLEVCAEDSQGDLVLAAFLVPDPDFLETGTPHKDTVTTEAGQVIGCTIYPIISKSRKTIGYRAKITWKESAQACAQQCPSIRSVFGTQGRGHL